MGKGQHSMGISLPPMRVFRKENPDQLLIDWR